MPVSKKTTSRTPKAVQEESDKSSSGTPERIMSATLALLTSQCIHSISIRDIARSSGANSALIAYHFGGKEQLYLAIVAAQFEAYRHQVIATFKADGDLSGNIRHACRAIAAFHLANPCWLTLYLRELSNPTSAYETVIKPCISEASKQCVAMITAGMEAGCVRPGINPRHVTLALVGMVNYFFMTRQVMQDLQLEPVNNVDSYIEFVSASLLQGILCCSTGTEG